MRPRILVLILLTGLFFLLAAAPLQTPPPPTPTAAPAPDLAGVYQTCVDKGLLYCLPNLWAALRWWALLVLAAGVLLWIASKYLGGLGKSIEKKGEEHGMMTLDGRPKNPMEEATSAYLKRFEKKYSQFSFRGLEDVSGAKVPEFDAAYISLRLSTATPRQRPLGNKTGPEETMMREAPVGYAGFFDVRRGLPEDSEGLARRAPGSKARPALMVG